MRLATSFWVIFFILQAGTIIIECVKTQGNEGNTGQQVEETADIKPESEIKTKVKRIRKPNFYSKEERIKRRAKTIFDSNEGKISYEDAKVAATKYHEEKRKITEKKRREKEIATGIKRNRSRKPEYGNKDGFIRRKIVQILGGKNGVFRHDKAKQIAEGLYYDYQRTNAARYRQRVRDRKQAQNMKEDRNEGHNPKQ